MHYSSWELAWIGLSVFMLGMSKGGFPAGTVALPILILVWPGETDAARSAVSFMLPMLCVMDVVAMAFYYRHVLWRRIWPLLPGTLLGVIMASLLFVSAGSSLVAVSDRTLKICIGTLGLLFVAYQAVRKWVLKRLDASPPAGSWMATLFGTMAGITSTLAHAAGPVFNMYILPQKLPKMNFAATTAAYFLILNMVKLAPFAAFGLLRHDNITLGVRMLPIIPFGVAAGYVLVRILNPRWYVAIIYAVLLAACLTLLWKAVQL